MADCYVAAATGCLKALHLPDNAFLNLNEVKTLDPKQHEVTCLEWNGQDQEKFLTAQVDRKVKMMDIISNNYSELFTVEGGTGKIKGLYVTPSDRIVTAVESGEVTVWDRKGEKITEMAGGKGLLCMNGDGDRLAVGGKECAVKLFDVESGKQIWISKNVVPDTLCLRVPIWETEVKILPGKDVVVTGTGTNCIRLYDFRVQRRPVRQCEWMDMPITAMSTCYIENQIFTGNTKGEMSLFDLRWKTKIMQAGKYKGQAGAIRSIVAHPTAPYVASCGIDRFARVHDMNTKKIVHKVYCKARLNKILMRTNMSILGDFVKKEEVEDDEDWEQMKANRTEGVSDEESEEGSDESEAEGDSEENEEEEGLWSKMEGGEKKKDKKKVAEPKDDDDDSEEGSDGEDEEESGESEEGEDGESEEDEPVPTKRVKLTRSVVTKGKGKKVEEVVKEDEDSDVEEILPKGKKPAVKSTSARGKRKF